MNLIIIFVALYILFINLFALSVIICGKIIIKYDKIKNEKINK